MASLTSISILLLFLLFAFFTIPIQSEKPQQLTRRNLALSEQESEEQPIPKPKPKKKNAAAQVEQSDDQPISKPKPKKKSSAQIEQEEESDDQPISKPKPKKKSSAQIEQEEESDDQPIPKPITKKKNPILDSKNQTKLIKPKKSNSTSIPTLASNSPKSSKLNKTLTLKPTNSTKIPKPPKNSTKSLNPTKPTKLNSTKIQFKSQNPDPKPAKKTKPVNPDPNPEPIWLDSDLESNSDLVAEFRDLPTRIHQALLPDLKKISITSKAYIYKANKNIADNVKPFFGNKFAPKIALAASCIFLILPLCLVTALFYHLHSYLPLHRLLIFAQAYLAIYFLTLALIAVVTGLEPLRFFHATSPSSYAWTQAVQTLGYLLYLLVQLIHLVVVFTGGESRMWVKVLGLVQMIVGLAVGAHYYSAVFHRAVTGDSPRANWKVHGIYAGCFLVICLCARAERRKKAYDGGEDGKLN